MIHFYVFIMNISYMEGTGSATINNAALPKYPEEEETPLIRNNKLRVNNSRKVGNSTFFLFFHCVGWGLTLLGENLKHIKII